MNHALNMGSIVDTTSILISGYCLNGQVEESEAIIARWLKLNSYMNHECNQLIEDLEISDCSRNRYFSTIEHRIDNTLKMLSPPISVWYSLLKMYSKRGAWKQTSTIVRHLQNGNFLTNSTTPSTNMLYYHLAISYYNGAHVFATHDLVEVLRVMTTSFQRHDSPVLVRPYFLLVSVLISKWDVAVRRVDVDSLCTDLVHLIVAMHDDIDCKIFNFNAQLDGDRDWYDCFVDRICGDGSAKAPPPSLEKEILQQRKMQIDEAITIIVHALSTNRGEYCTLQYTCHCVNGLFDYVCVNRTGGICRIFLAISEGLPRH